VYNHIVREARTRQHYRYQGIGILDRGTSSAGVEHGASTLSTWILVIVASVLMAVCNTGCVHRPAIYAEHDGLLCTVSLPPLTLAYEEYIQSLEVTIADGRVATINQTWDDWDMELDWDSPRDLALKCHARHFSSGFQSTQAFNRFMTVQVKGTSFDIMATVRTASTDNTGRGEREYHISPSEIVLTPRPHPALWLSKEAFYRCPEDGVYIVQWGYSAREIAAQCHLSIEQLSLLNPGVDLSNLKVGQKIHVAQPSGK